MNRQKIFEMIVGHVRDVVPGLRDHHFADGDQLQALGVSSIDRAEIVTLVLEELSLDVPRAQALGEQSIGGLADLLHEKLKAA
jgi:polyketide biosynthesis acyl carrier protein